LTREKVPEFEGLQNFGVLVAIGVLQIILTRRSDLAIK
jgi:hypothetical protein